MTTQNFRKHLSQLVEDNGIPLTGLSYLSTVCAHCTSDTAQVTHK